MSAAHYLQTKKDSGKLKLKKRSMYRCGSYRLRERPGPHGTVAVPAGETMTDLIQEQTWQNKLCEANILEHKQRLCQVKITWCMKSIWVFLTSYIFVCCYIHCGLWDYVLCLCKQMYAMNSKSNSEHILIINIQYIEFQSYIQFI